MDSNSASEDDLFFDDDAILEKVSSEAENLGKHLEKH